MTVCTTYTKREAVEELVQLNQSLEAKIIQRSEENKWRSLVALLETGDGPEHSVYYENYSWYMFRARLEFVSVY